MRVSTQYYATVTFRYHLSLSRPLRPVTAASPCRWSCPSLTAADVRSATEIAAYRALSERVCAEIEEQTSQGPLSCLPIVGSAHREPVGGKTKRQDLHGGGGRAADLPIDNTAMARQSIPPRTLGVSQQERHLTGGDFERGGHGRDAIALDNDLRTGSTFLTAVQQPEGQYLKRSPVERGESETSAGHGASTISQPAVVEYGATTTDGDGEIQSPARETLSDLSKPGNTTKKTNMSLLNPLRQEATRGWFGVR